MNSSQIITRKRCKYQLVLLYLLQARVVKMTRGCDGAIPLPRTGPPEIGFLWWKMCTHWIGLGTKNKYLYSYFPYPICVRLLILAYTGIILDRGSRRSGKSREIGIRENHEREFPTNQTHQRMYVFPFCTSIFACTTISNVK